MTRRRIDYRTRSGLIVTVTEGGSRERVLRSQGATRLGEHVPAPTEPAEPEPASVEPSAVQEPEREPLDAEDEAFIASIPDMTEITVAQIPQALTDADLGYVEAMIRAEYVGKHRKSALETLERKRAELRAEGEGSHDG